jgi:hypothetical protein
MSSSWPSTRRTKGWFILVFHFIACYFVTKPTKHFVKARESGQPARFLAAMRLRAAIRFSLGFIIVLQVLFVL